METGNYDMKALIERLKPMAEAGYRDFNLSLMPDATVPALGVRMPALRAVGRELLKDDWRAFLEASRDYPLFEARMLHAIVLGGARCGVEEKLRLTDAFLPYVDDWGICDALCASFKPRQDDRAALFEFLIACAASDEAYTKRFGLVMMMSYYRDEPYIDRVMEAYRSFSHPGYYARMGAAWGLATLFLTRREDVLDILTSGVLDDFTHNKTLQKLRESYRVSKEDKDMLRALRRRRLRDGQNRDEAN